MDPPLEDEWELVHEGQRYKGDLSIETVFGRCSVLFCGIDEVPKKLVGRLKDKSCVFFCRFALAPGGKGSSSRGFVPVKDYPELVDREVAIKVAAAESAEASPMRPSRSAKKSLAADPEFNNNTPSRSSSKGQSSRRTPRRPARYGTEEEPLPSPLKNATFSVTSSGTKELRIVIQRCNVKSEIYGEAEAEPEEQSHVKIKARKKLDLEATPTKVFVVAC